MIDKTKLAVQYIAVNILKLAEYNLRRWDETAKLQIKERIN